MRHPKIRPVPGDPEIRFDERGLVPCIVQDWESGEVLTLAYMNAEALRRTRRIIRKAGIADGDMAMLIMRTADNLRQIMSLQETHPETAELAAAAGRRSCANLSYLSDRGARPKTRIRDPHSFVA